MMNSSPRNDASISSHNLEPKEVSSSKLEIILLGDPDSQSSAEEGTSCGFFSYRVPYLQRFANIKVFTGLCSLIIFLQSAITSGYTFAVLTTIEKQFNIASITSGLMASAYEVGNLLTILFVSHYGGRQRVPTWLGGGAFLMSCGVALFTVPHFLKMAYFREGYVNRGYTDTPWEFCDSARNDSKQENDICSSETGEPHGFYIALFVIAQFTIGTGMGPVATIGATYIDDHVMPREASSFYLSFIYAGAALGPVFGYLLGSLMLTVDIGGHADIVSSMQNMTSYSSNNWSGAWWGGYLFFCLVLLQLSWIICLFPKTLPGGRNPEAAAGRVVTENTSLIGLYKDIKLILRTPQFLFVTLAVTFESGVASGFCLFLPKYLESQFNLAKPLAGTLTGSVAVPAAALGVICGGWLNRRYKPSPLRLSKVILQMGMVCLVAFIPLFFFYCSPDLPKGVNLNIRLPDRSDGFVHESFCSAECDCLSTTYQPVCDELEQTTYLSPCTAGCTEKLNHGFGSCSCVESGVVVDGQCPTKCMITFVLFLLDIFLMAFCFGNTHLPIILLTMRSVKTHCKSLALAMQVLIVRLIAFIPAPIIFGHFIDHSCIRWSASECQTGDTTGACMFYDLDRFHMYYISLACAMHVASCVFLWLNYFVIRRDTRETSELSLEDKLEGENEDAQLSTVASLGPMRGALVHIAPQRAHVSFVVA